MSAGREKVRRGRGATRSPATQPNLTSYWDRSQWPLQSLYFLIPLLAGYTLGSVWLAGGGAERLPAIFAEDLLGRFFALAGVGHQSMYLPAICLVVVLLCAHVARRDPWTPEPRLYLLMAAESIVFALPLFVLSTLAAGMDEPPPLQALAPAAMTPPVAVGAAPGSFWEGVVFAIGAGLYEELLFRFMLIALLHLLLKNVLALPQAVCDWSAVGLAAVAFAAYHFAGGAPFDASLFAFFTLAGLYLGVIFITRGFGIVVAVHAIYDVLAVATHQRFGG